MNALDLTPKNRKTLPTVLPKMNEIIELGAEFFEIPSVSLKSEVKIRDIADARRIISSEILRRVQNVEIEHIAHVFNKTRVGIYHGINNIQTYTGLDPVLRKRVQNFQDYLEVRL